jgi:hypothetical protein
MTSWPVRLCAVGCLGIAVLVPSTLPAASESGVRACAKADLVGSWDMVRIATPPASSVALDARDPSYYPHQRFVFQEDGRVRHLTSTVPLAASSQPTALAIPSTTTWSLDDQGFLTLRQSAAPAPEPVLCGYLIQADPRSAGPVRTGDVLLTYYKNRKPILFRHLRKSK